ncbi:hypothetical protein ACIQJW_08170 [Streptomyces californicus]|uniref:hypothetical protein n=1 Tax=Streptomyces californicus TaxID=67351 RepID=UPI00381627AD
MSDTPYTNLDWAFDHSRIVESWLCTVNNGEFTPKQEKALVDALVDAQVEEFDNLLPDGCAWEIRERGISYTENIDQVEKEDLESYLNQSAEIVLNRLPEIEAKVLADLT